MSIELLYQHFKNSTGVCTDTRKIEKDCLFFALKGANFNGNEFALKAIGSGASFAVVDEVHGEQHSNMIVVEDVLTTLQNLARHHRQQLTFPILGITGTNGKTTTKELVVAVLETQKKVGYTLGNLNNHIGVPLTLLSFKEDLAFGVVEMGANHPGEIAELCQISLPDHALVTNAGEAHLEGFGSYANIIETKHAMYRAVDGKAEALAFYHENNTYFSAVNAELIYFGGEEKSTVKGKILSEVPFLQVELDINGQTTTIQTQLFGAYNLANILAAAAVGNSFGISAENIKKGLENYTPTNNRSQYLKTDRNELFLDAYNANPTSLHLAIENFASLHGDNKLMILGDMFELGEGANKHHQTIADLAAETGVTTLLVGNHFAVTTTTAQKFNSTQDLKAYLVQHAVSGKQILIKGSRGIGLEKVVEVL